MKTKIRSKTMLMLMIFSISIFSNCGKKGPLKLDPEVFPSGLNTLNVVQIGNDLTFSWKFPKFLNDNKTIVDISQIRKIYFYYTDRPLVINKTKEENKVSGSGDQSSDINVPSSIFLKKGRLLKKIDTNQLESNNMEYFFVFKDIPGKFLNKTLFIAVNYKYKKLSSEISNIREIKIMSPVNPVKDLSVINENKVIKLKWTKTNSGKKAKKSPVISGFNIFRKVEQEGSEGKVSFTKINRDIVLKEYYEDSDTGVSGKYYYYVSAMASNLNISEKSNIANVNIKDIFPPEIPENILIFKSSKGLMLSWRKVKDKDLSHYKLYRKADGETEFKILETKLVENKYLDDKVKSGVKYSYYITTVDNNGNESDNSKTSSESF